MKKYIIITVVAGMLAWSFYEFFGSSANETGQEDAGLETGQAAPDYEVETLGGDTVKLSDYRGEPVIINFWATWCPPCRAEMPDFEKLHKEEDAVILAVNLTHSENNISGVSAFVDELGLTMPVLLDAEGSVEDSYQLSAYPTSYMIDSEGVTQYVVRGAINYETMYREYMALE